MPRNVFPSKPWLNCMQVLYYFACCQTLLPWFWKTHFKNFMPKFSLLHRIYPCFFHDPCRISRGFQKVRDKLTEISRQHFANILQDTCKMYLWSVFSCSESFRLLKWLVENTALEQGSPRERSPVGSRFSESLFLDVAGTATDQVRTCGFRKKSPSLDKAPKMRDTVRLNSSESFQLPSLQSLQKPGRCTLEPFPVQVCFATDCSLYF